MLHKPVRIEIPTIFGMETVNAWLFREPEPILVDCGELTEAAWEAVVSGLKDNGLQLTDLSRIVITHAHVDHMGMAARLAQESGAKVWVNEYVKPWALQLDEMRANRRTLMLELLAQVQMGPEHPMVQLFNGFFEQFRAYWEPVPEDALQVFDVDATLEMGGRTWQSMYLPGHCVNQTGFYQPESGALLSADMLLSKTPTPVIDNALEPPYGRTNAMHQLLHSFDQLRQLDIQEVYPGHYGIITDAQHLIERQLKRIDERKEECFGHLSKGTQTFLPLMQAMYGDKVFPPTVAMLIGYLDLLASEGRITWAPEQAKWKVVDAPVLSR